eukprot:GHVP01034460.1.p1 GENE.GHVP01034460.1~~GHVP01034460.1.p1  ORF type:complete len:108 (-),score=21.43 GHVP01034460.1:351-632(-)
MEIGDSDMKLELQLVFEESLSTYLCSASHYEKTISDKKKNELIELLLTKLKEELMIFLEYRQFEIIQEASKSIEAYVTDFTVIGSCSKSNCRG